MPISFMINFISSKLQIQVINFDTELMLQNISINTFFEILYKSGLLVQVIVVQIIHFVVITIYYAALIVKFGTTPGKKLLHCKVVNSITGCKPSIQQAVIRSICMPLSICTAGIGLVMIEFTKKNQALHDKIAETLVIYDKKS